MLLVPIPGDATITTNKWLCGCVALLSEPRVQGSITALYVTVIHVESSYQRTNPYIQPRFRSVLYSYRIRMFIITVRVRVRVQRNYIPARLYIQRNYSHRAPRPALHCMLFMRQRGEHAASHPVSRCFHFFEARIGGHRAPRVVTPSRQRLLGTSAKLCYYYSYCSVRYEGIWG